MQFFVRDDLIFRKRMFPADKNMWFCYKELMEFQIIGFQDFCEHYLIEIIEKQDSDLTPHTRHILDDLIRLCLPYAEIIFILSIFLDQINKCIDRKGIMLRGDTKLLLSTGAVLIFVLQNICLLQHLSRISKEILPLLG